MSILVEQNSPPSPLRRVRSISVDKLFGLYDHTVDLFLDHRITIIHGPNGVGKTTLLRLTHGVFSQDYALLFSVPFDQLSFELDDGTTINIRKVIHEAQEKSRSDLPKGKLKITFTRPDWLIPQEFELAAEQLRFDEWAAQHEGSMPWVHKVGADRWLDQRTETIMSAFELWNSNSIETGERSLSGLQAVVPESFNEVAGLVNTYFVEAQRLVRLGSSNRRRWTPYGTHSITPAVNYDAKDLASRVKDSFTQYGRVSQRLDQTFPQRLFEYGRELLSNEQITESIKALEKERERLEGAGILDEISPYPFDVSKIDQADPAQLAAMSLYVEDSKLKLNVLSELASRVEPLLTSINAKFKNKRIQLDKEKGLVATISGGGELRPDQLSSGEQHEIVLLYNLLFRVAPNTLVLIDEPELSLHIEWQRRVLPELLGIAANARIDALVATHSPSIVGDRDDLMIALDADRDDIIV